MRRTFDTRTALWEQINMADPQVKWVKSSTDLETNNRFRIPNPDYFENSSLSPNVAELRPKQQIRLPARYRDESPINNASFR